MAPIGDPALEDHPHSANSLEPPLEILEQRDVVAADDEQELDVGERERRQGGEKERRVARAVAVRFGRIVERRLLAQVPGSALDTTRCADDSHPVREPRPPGADSRGRL